jgi:uncharacterized protein with HEPN domain
MPTAKLPQVRLGHMLDEIDAIMAATYGMTADAVRDDYLTMRAVERAIQIISEAAKELPAAIRQEEPEIPWSDIIGIGNLLRHEYYRIDAAGIQSILFDHLPRLRPAVLRLLSRFES